MQLTRTTAPAAEPVTLTEAKAHLLVTESTDDTYIGRLIQAAREHIENVTNRVYVSQSWTAYLDDLPVDDLAYIELRRPPLISVTSVKYYDNDNVLQTWDSANYVVDTDQFLGRIYPARTKSWPTPRNFPKSVEIEFVAGYADSGASPQDLADNVPEAIKQAILIMIAHWYENREPVIVGTNVAEVPFSAKVLYQPYKVYNF